MAWSEMLNLLVLIFVKYICCPDRMQEIYTIHFQPDATCIFWCINTEHSNALQSESYAQY